MPATGKFGPNWLRPFVRAGFAVTTCRSGTARKVVRGVAGCVKRPEPSPEFRRSARVKESMRSRQSISIKWNGGRENLLKLSSVECR